jgi:hypothetical protein
MKNNYLFATFLGCLSLPLCAEELQQQSAPLPPANILQAQTASPSQHQEQSRIDCQYRASPSTQQVDAATLNQWAQNAITQSFAFTYNNLDSELNALKNCFTENGWQSFNDALIKSGNIEAIRNQQLTVNSQLEGQLNIVENKQNQWKASVPLQVVYQNNQEKVLQQLNVDIMIGRKSSGSLGIMQIVATPRDAKPVHAQEQSLNTQPLATSTSPAQPIQEHANPTPNHPQLNTEPPLVNTLPLEQHPG